MSSGMSTMYNRSLDSLLVNARVKEYFLPGNSSLSNLLHSPGFPVSTPQKMDNEERYEFMRRYKIKLGEGESRSEDIENLTPKSKMTGGLYTRSLDGFPVDFTLTKCSFPTNSNSVNVLHNHSTLSKVPLDKKKKKRIRVKKKKNVIEQEPENEDEELDDWLVPKSVIYSDALNVLNTYIPPWKFESTSGSEKVTSKKTVESKRKAYVSDKKNMEISPEYINENEELNDSFVPKSVVYSDALSIPFPWKLESTSSSKKVTPKKKRKSKKKSDASIRENAQLLPISINFSIKVMKYQNNSFIFRKRNSECQLVSFEYSPKLPEPFIFDSRDFVKLNVLNETTEIGSDTILGDGTFRRRIRNKTNQINNLQSSTSHARIKKNKQKPPKESDKIVPYEDYYDMGDVEEQLKTGELVKGPLRINAMNPKVAYVADKDRDSQDYIIKSVSDRNRALEGDVVVLRLKPESEWVGNQRCASVVHILQKVHPRTAVGFLHLFYSKGHRLVAVQPRDRRVPKIVVPRTSLPPLYFQNPTDHDNTLYLAKITEWEQPKYAEGAIIETIGLRNHLKTETIALLKENELDVTPFPPSIYKYLPISSIIPQHEFTYREDLRKECIFTIDPLTARDLDDAVSCKNLPNGNLEIGVHIADVSFFLEENTELDDIVTKKGTTIYLVDNVYHMLPVELCLHCSLLPGKDVLAFSVFFEMTEDGEILSHRFGRTIMNSCCQLAYEHAQDMIDHPDDFDNTKLPDIYNGYTSNDICGIVNKLQRISANLRQKRFDNGALRIDQIKILFKLGADGKPCGFYKYENIEAHRLIEELMLLANITVARRILNDFSDIAFLRCHESPNPRLMKETQENLETVGVHINIKSSGAIHNSLESYSTNDYLGIARNAVLNHFFAKAMTRAKYFCAGLDDYYEHYALSVDTYTHFTSPIRRYADIMVHRLLAASLGYSSKPNWTVEFVEEIAANCNKQKYNAKKAGEASSDLFLAHYVDENQPFIDDAVVIVVREKSFNAMVLSTGSIVTILTNNLPKGTKYETEKVSAPQSKLSRMILTYPDNKQQIIEIFQIVKVQLKRKTGSFNLEGELLQPE